MRGYTRHSPRISWAPSIVSVPLTFSAALACQIFSVSYFKLSLAGRSRRSKKTGSTAIYGSSRRAVAHYTITKWSGKTECQWKERKENREKKQHTFVLLRFTSLTSPTFSPNVLQQSDTSKTPQNVEYEEKSHKTSPASKKASSQHRRGHNSQLPSVNVSFVLLLMCSHFCDLPLVLPYQHHPVCGNPCHCCFLSDENDGFNLEE